MSIYFQDDAITLHCGDALAVLRAMSDESVNCCVTSPPYWSLRDYGIAGQIGQEKSPQEFVGKLIEAFEEVRRVLKKDGTCWLNLGDSSAADRGGAGMPAETLAGGVNGHGDGNALRGRGEREQVNHRRNSRAFGLKHKELCGIPWRVAFALQESGWYLRSDIIWAKPNAMPESVLDRPTRSHEYIFLLTKSEKYWYDSNAVKLPAKDPTDDARRLAAAAFGHKTHPTDKVNGIRARANGSTLTGGDYGRHHLGDAIPEKDRREAKQRGHSRRRAGFNERWDGMDKTEQMQGGANLRDVWWISPAQYTEAHFATFPAILPTLCIKAGCPPGGIVLDPFAGSGTTLEVARNLGRKAVGIELNPAYCELAKKRVELPLFT